MKGDRTWGKTGGNASSPARLDPRLVEQALAGLADLWDVPVETLSFEVGRGIRRPRSILFKLKLMGPRGLYLEAFYKIFQVKASGSTRGSGLWWSELVSVGLARSLELSSRLGQVAAPHRIRVERILAVDATHPSLIVARVPGEPFGHPLLRHAWSPSRREAAVEALERAGLAVRLLEELPVGIPEVDDSLHWKTFNLNLRRYRGPLSPHELRSLERVMEQLYRDVMQHPKAVVWCHGDMSAENLLVGRDEIGLVDFMWIPRLRGYDLATFAFRLQHQHPRLGWWTGRLVRAMLEGYGNLEAPGEPGWRFARLQRVLALTNRSFGRLDPRRVHVSRAAEELKAFL